MIDDIAGISPWALPAIGLTLVVATIGARRVATLVPTSPGVAWVLIASLGGVFALTLTPHQPDSGLAAAFRCDFGVHGLLSVRDVMLLNDRALNVALFMPLGFGLALIRQRRRQVLLIGFAAVLPVLVESAQSVATVLDRACQAQDLVDNSSGLVAGLVIGCLAGWLWRRRRPRKQPRSLAT